MADDFQSSFTSALNSLNNSVNVPSYTPPALTGYQNPGYTSLNLSPWTMQASDFGPGTAAPSNPLSSPSGGTDASTGLQSTPWDSTKSFLGNVWQQYVVDPVHNIASSPLGQFFQREGAAAMSGLNSVVSDNKTIMQMLHGGGDPSTMVSPISSYAQGWNNPASAPTGKDVVTNMVGHDFFGSGIAGFGASLLDPISMVPIGKAAQIADKGLGVLTGIGKAADAANVLGHGAAGVEAGKSIPLPTNPAESVMPNNPLSDEHNLQNLFQSHAPDWSNEEFSAPQTQHPIVQEQGNAFQGQYQPPAGSANTAQSEAAQIAQEMKDLQNYRDEVAKGKLDALNSANDQGILKELQNAGVRRPLQGDAFYSEFKNLEPSLQRLFQPGNVGQSALSFDEFANQKGMNAASLLDALNNARGKYTAADLAHDPELQQIDQTLQALQQAHGDALQRTTNWKAPDDSNFLNLAKSMPAGHDVLNPPENPFVGYGQTAATKTAQAAESAVAPNLPGFLQRFVDQAQGVKNSLGNAFVKYYGLSPEEKAALYNFTTNQNYANHLIQEHAQDLIDQHAADLTKSELESIPHMIEGTQPVSAKLEPLINALKDLRGNGIGGQYGTVQEQATMWNGKPVLQNFRQNYFPHYYEATPQATDRAFRKYNVQTGGSFNQQRQLPDLKTAEEAGLKPLKNPILAYAKRVSSGAKAIHNVQLFNDLLQNGSLKKVIKDVPKNPTAEQLSMLPKEDVEMAKKGYAVNELPQGWINSAIPQLSGYALSPYLENALQDAFRMNDQSGPIWNMLRSGSGKYKRLTVMNPMVHGHNIIGNFYVAGGSPSDMAKTMQQMRDGSFHDVIDQARQYGAISKEDNSLDREIKSYYSRNVKQNPLVQGLKKAAHAPEAALWKTDEVLRGTLFRKFTEQGLNPVAAADRVNHYMIDYNNLTPFERKYMNVLLPFYSWKKGNVPMQFQNLITNTPRMMAYQKALNATQNSLDGQNAKDGKLDTGIKLADGSHVLIDPYSPLNDPFKVMTEGALPYIYGSVNPGLKIAADLGSNQRYYPNPLLAPAGKESMASSPLTQPGRTDNAQRVGALLAGEVAPVSGALGSLGSLLPGGGGADGRDALNSAFGLPTKGKPPTTPVESLTKLLGGFTSRDNPTMDAYYQKKDAQTAQQNYQSQQRQYGNPVSKAQVKQSHKKIPFPVAGQ